MATLSPLYQTQQQCRDQLKPNLKQDSVLVYKGMRIHDIATTIGDKLGCGYQQLIQSQVRSQLQNILKSGTATNKSKEQQQNWRQQMEKILATSIEQPTLHNSQAHHITQTPQQSKIKYFQMNYDKIIKTRSQKHFITNQNIQNSNGIYERGVLKRKKTEEKLCMIKKNKQNQQIQQCTFTPNIHDTFQFFNKKNPKFFNQKRQNNNLAQSNTFQKLYKQSFDIKQKRKQRLRTLQNEQQSKISQLSFIPHINQCSRQICKLKSYASFIQQASQNNQRQEDKLKSWKISRDNTIKKETIKLYTFQPQISENTKRLTKNLPSFYQRLQKSLQKKQKKADRNVNIAAEKNSKIKNQKVQKTGKVSNKIKLKKQVYTIDYEDIQQSEAQTEKKNKNNQVIFMGTFDNSAEKQNIFIDESQINAKQDFVEPPTILKTSNNSTKVQNRSRQLFQQRKRTILETIVKYMSIKPSVSVGQYSKNRCIIKLSDDFEIDDKDVQSNPFIPKFVKNMLSPITQELKELEVPLSKQQFLSALQKLFQELSISDRGSLLGWGIKLLPEQNK